MLDSLNKSKANRERRRVRKGKERKGKIRERKIVTLIGQELPFLHCIGTCQ